MSRALNVAVLGSGSWGSTVASICARNANTLIWGRRADVAEQINREHVNGRYLEGLKLYHKLRATTDLEEAVADCDVLVVGIPSHSFRGTLKAVAPHLRPWVPVISLAKGLEQGTQRRMTQIIQEELPGHPAGLLAGPNIAREILQGMAAAAVVAMPDESLAGALRPIFSSTLFRVYTNTDVIGCELGGPLKNVIAISAGMAQGLSVGENTRAMVITRGLNEITRLGVAMGGNADSFAGLTGLGDLLTTCMSPLSRNRRVGEQFAAGKTTEQIVASMNMVAEGIKTSSVVMEIAAAHGVEMPIASEVAAVVRGDYGAVKAFRGLRKITPGAEHDSG